MRNRAAWQRKDSDQHRSRERTADCCVIGAGPAGRYSYLLARRGLRVTLLDACQISTAYRAKVTFSSLSGSTVARHGEERYCRRYGIF
jgi:hypothetical protein